MSCSNPLERPRFVCPAFFRSPFHRFSGVPIFLGLAARFADRIAALSPCTSASLSSSFKASFLLFTFRGRPESESLFGYQSMTMSHGLNRKSGIQTFFSLAVAFRGKSLLRCSWTCLLAAARWGVSLILGWQGHMARTFSLPFILAALEPGPSRTRIDLCFVINHVLSLVKLHFRTSKLTEESARQRVGQQSRLRTSFSSFSSRSTVATSSFMSSSFFAHLETASEGITRCRT